jgi:hypothetical protein
MLEPMRKRGKSPRKFNGEERDVRNARDRRDRRNRRRNCWDLFPNSEGADTGDRDKA